MRILALYVAFVLMAIGLVLPRSWAHADLAGGHDAYGSPLPPTGRLSVGLRDYSVQMSYEYRTDPLSELNDAGVSFEHEALAVLVFGCIAGIGCAAASVVIRKQVSIGIRTILLVTQVGSLIATLVFVHRLLGFRYLDLGWSVPLTLASTILGAGAMLAWPSRPAI